MDSLVRHYVDALNHGYVSLLETELGYDRFELALMETLCRYESDLGYMMEPYYG